MHKLMYFLALIYFSVGQYGFLFEKQEIIAPSLLSAIFVILIAMYLREDK